MIHPFFNDIITQPDLAQQCRTDLIQLPEPFVGENQLKAILLGADPTNDGIKAERGLKQLKTVFGINSEFERFFFNPQKTNLNAIGLKKNDLYIQNVCRNYFKDPTSENKSWNEIAKIWIPYLIKELGSLDDGLPVLITAEKIMKLFVPEIPGASVIYNLNHKPPFYSVDLKRYLIPFYRHPSYLLSKNWDSYRKYIKQLINE